MFFFNIFFTLRLYKEPFFWREQNTKGMEGATEDGIKAQIASLQDQANQLRREANQLRAQELAKAAIAAAEAKAKAAVDAAEAKTATAVQALDEMNTAIDSSLSTAEETAKLLKALVHVCVQKQQATSLLQQQHNAAEMQAVLNIVTGAADGTEDLIRSANDHLVNLQGARDRLLLMKPGKDKEPAVAAAGAGGGAGPSDALQRNFAFHQVKIIKSAPSSRTTALRGQGGAASPGRLAAQEGGMYFDEVRGAEGAGEEQLGAQGVQGAGTEQLGAQGAQGAGAEQQGAQGARRLKRKTRSTSSEAKSPNVGEHMLRSSSSQGLSPSFSPLGAYLSPLIPDMTSPGHASCSNLTLLAATASCNSAGVYVRAPLFEVGDRIETSIEGSEVFYAAHVEKILTATSPFAYKVKFVQYDPANSAKSYMEDTMRAAPLHAGAGIYWFCILLALLFYFSSSPASNVRSRKTPESQTNWTKNNSGEPRELPEGNSWG